MIIETDTAKTADEPIWKRGLIMLVFLVLFGIAETILAVIAVAQVLWTAFTGKPNVALVDFGSMLGEWAREVTQYQSMKSDTRPFPWGDWPKE